MNAYSPSLLDKLQVAASGGPDGTTRLHTVDQVRDSVARDIEMLLNTHQAHSPQELTDFPNAAKSVLTLGLVDIASMSLASDRDRRMITDAIRESLTAHDKRLADVEVSVRQTGTSSSVLTFSIRAQLILRADLEQVCFDAVLQPGSNRYDVARFKPRAGPAPR